MFDLPEALSYSYILSTGRTGTVFVSSYLSKSSQNITCVHEPSPSRFLIPLTNKYYDNQISHKDYASKYFNKRSAVLQNNKHRHYIEVNNFIWAGVHALNHYLPNPSVVHIIRHPQDYVLSHLNFGFWSFQKRLIRKYGSYFLVDQHLTKQEKENPIIILIKRWILINTHLETYQDTNPYLCLRFEDLFSKQEVSSYKTFKQLQTFLGLNDITEEQHTENMNVVKNQSVNKKYSLSDIEPYFKEYFTALEPLMTKFDYTLKHG